MPKRKYFLKVLVVSPQGGSLEYTDVGEPVDTPEMRQAFGAFTRAVQRYLNARKHETLKAQRSDGPVCGSVSLADVAASPGLQLGARHYLDRLPLELIASAQSIIIDGVVVKHRGPTTDDGIPIHTTTFPLGSIMGPPDDQR